MHIVKIFLAWTATAKSGQALEIRGRGQCQMGECAQKLESTTGRSFIVIICNKIIFFHTTAGRGLRRINDPRTAPNDAAGKKAEPESRNSKHKRDARCYCTLRKTAEEEARKFEDHVTEDTTKADRHRPACRHSKATGNGREQQCS